MISVLLATSRAYHSTDHYSCAYHLFPIHISCISLLYYHVHPGLISIAWQNLPFISSIRSSSSSIKLFLGIRSRVFVHNLLFLAIDHAVFDSSALLIQYFISRLIVICW